MSTRSSSRLNRAGRKRAKDSLQKLRMEAERAEKLQQLFDFVPQHIAVLGPDGQLPHINRMAREYFGLTTEQPLPTEIMGNARFVHPDDLERVRAVRKHGFAGVAPFEYDARLRRKDGAYRWFLLRYNPLIEEGRVQRWYATATEIDSRKLEEERIRQENVRLEERTRIAQELHDTLLQSFNAATMKLGVAVQGLPSNSALKSKVDSILELMEQGIAEGRTAIQGLRASDTCQSDLVTALSEIQKELMAQADVDFRVKVVGQQRAIPAPVRQELYRIAKEAVVNAFCHSRAKRIEVELEYRDARMCIRVCDNGCGIDPTALEKGLDGHWGLTGMRERAARIGGQLKISSTASAGTEIRLSVPGNVAYRLT